jgi:hypothetical protein
MISHGNTEQNGLELNVILMYSMFPGIIKIKPGSSIIGFSEVA